jgi:hypothetical protein
VALDQNVTPPAPDSKWNSAIENELPAYRAVNPHAVISLILGILGILSFANSGFLILAALAVAFGLYAQRRIQRDPEIWTGRGLAQAGTALGLAFGLAALTIGFTQSYLRQREAAGFARYFAKVIKSRPMEDVLWFSIVPQSREGKPARQIYQELKKSSSQSDREIEMQLGQAMDFKRAVDANPGSEVHFVKIESHGLEGLNPYAAALYEVHLPSKNGGESEQYGLLVFSGDTQKNRTRWWLRESKYPYVPSSYVAAPKPVDDGHGHGHSH